MQSYPVMGNLQADSSSPMYKASNSGAVRVQNPFQCLRLGDEAGVRVRFGSIKKNSVLIHGRICGDWSEA